MSRVTKTLGAGVAALGLLLGTAGVATADDQSYLEYARASGVPNNLYFPDWGVIQMGHAICDLLRGGRPVESIQYFGYTGLFRDQIVGAAQHELCPDTLPH
ncbi:DUF732 domain-containing protein [Mycolicibacter heraklionensis]|uniref:DUF732 domain-containing protein n=1 Tax=Mycolicibacter heraklionensis TaxID=512402 RepID=A0A9X7WLC3_9MYCO|nr:DUF732 domain-containing protein [Mycolicibacter heraklionensis]